MEESVQVLTFANAVPDGQDIIAKHVRMYVKLMSYCINISINISQMHNICIRIKSCRCAKEYFHFVCIRIYA